MSRAGPVSRASVSLPGSRHVCQTQQKSTSRLHDNRASPVSRDPGITVPGSRLTGLRFLHVIPFESTKSSLLRFPTVLRISHQPGWLASCNTGLKVISAHRSSPANRASPAHVIRPSDTKKTAKKLYWIEMEQSGKSNVTSEVRTFDIK